jgi:hypothetical protein
MLSEETIPDQGQTQRSVGGPFRRDAAVSDDCHTASVRLVLLAPAPARRGVTISQGG